MTDNNEPARAHHDENLVPSYTLPDPLTFETGEPVTADTWPLRRKEILTLFRDNMYGYPPDLDPQFEVKVIREVPLPGSGIDFQQRPVYSSGITVSSSTGLPARPCVCRLKLPGQSYGPS